MPFKMHGIDTNVLVRFLVRDDLLQSKQAARFFKKHCSPATPGWISVIVLCEMAWVLSRGYRYEKPQVTAVIDHLLRTPFLLIEDEGLVRNALQIWINSRSDFPDLLIAERNRQAGCGTTFTFDGNASSAPGFSPVPKR